jgi:DNA modification methylase
MNLNTINEGDCLELLKNIPDNSVDSIVTDPPYGIRFMGKKWDYEIPSVEIWKECLRVLKPGGHALIACGTRTQHRMVVNIEDAGFEVRDVITWHYGQGFPKSLDISKAIDKRANNEDLPLICNWLKQRREIKKLTREYVAKHLGLTSTAIYNWEEKPIQYGFPTKENWNKIKGLYGFDGTWDDFKREAEREVIGERKKGFVPNCNSIYGQFSGDTSLTAPSTEQAKQWEGWGTALKPATEFWTLCRKPLSESTVAENVLKHGTGGINIDGCRIGDEIITSKDDPNKFKRFKEQDGRTPTEHDFTSKTTEGRFPANLILDEFTAGLLDEQSGILTSGSGNKNSIRDGKTHGQNLFIQKRNYSAPSIGGDSGGASRFFYVAKPDGEERKAFNNHPTVKPLKLMQYLIKLITPKGGLVVDPYCGSGTTLVAAALLGFDYIGMDLEEANCTISRKRLQSELGMFNKCRIEIPNPEGSDTTGSE